MVGKAWVGGFTRGPPRLARALKGIERPDAGALAVLAPSARDVALRVTRNPQWRPVFRRALQRGKTRGALAARIWHGTGRIPAGQPMVVVAAVAKSRKAALAAVDAMMNALKGVAARSDASSA